MFVGVEARRELDRIAERSRRPCRMGRSGSSTPKEPTGVADTTIFGKAKALGLVYTKVARVSETHTAEKLVRPRDKR